MLKKEMKEEGRLGGGTVAISGKHFEHHALAIINHLLHPTVVLSFQKTVCLLAKIPL